MIVSVYINKWVKIDISNGYYYEGIVIDYDKDSIMIKDKKEKFVSLKINNILNIREVSK